MFFVVPRTMRPEADSPLVEPDDPGREPKPRPFPFLPARGVRRRLREPSNCAALALRPTPGLFTRFISALLPGSPRCCRGMPVDDNAAALAEPRMPVGALPCTGAVRESPSLTDDREPLRLPEPAVSRRPERPPGVPSRTEPAVDWPSCGAASRFSRYTWVSSSLILRRNVTLSLRSWLHSLKPHTQVVSDTPCGSSSSGGAITYLMSAEFSARRARDAALVCAMRMLSLRFKPLAWRSTYSFWRTTSANDANL